MYGEGGCSEPGGVIRTEERHLHSWAVAETLARARGTGTQRSRTWEKGGTGKEALAEVGDVDSCEYEGGALPNFEDGAWML